MIVIASDVPSTVGPESVPCVELVKGQDNLLKFSFISAEKAKQKHDEREGGREGGREGWKVGKEAEEYYVAISWWVYNLLNGNRGRKCIT